MLGIVGGAIDDETPTVIGIEVQLPADREDERTRWAERLGQQADEVLVDRKGSLVPVRLFGIAPNKAEADRLEQELAALS